MKTLAELKRLDPPAERLVVALGTFDGVHRGHQAILGSARDMADAMGGVALAFTFNRHPMEVIASRPVPPLLTTLEDKERLLRENGMDSVLVAEFDQEFARMPAEAFVREILVGVLQTQGVVCGYNYTFGYRARGDVDLLRTLGQQHDFKVTVVNPVTYGGKQVSSTIVRRLVQEGRVTEAGELLGRPYRLAGTVVTGDGRGRVLGFPTANVQPAPGIVVPQDGVYITDVLMRDATEREEWLPGGAALTVIGNKPTFGGGKERTVETFVLDYSGDLYDQELDVAFLTRLRGLTRFDTADDLKRQIKRDIVAAKSFFQPA